MQLGADEITSARQDFVRIAIQVGEAPIAIQQSDSIAGMLQDVQHGRKLRTARSAALPRVRGHGRSIQ